MIISPGVFSFFENFDFLGCCGGRGRGRGVKGQKMVQNKHLVRHAQDLRNHRSYDCHLWYTCLK